MRFVIFNLAWESTEEGLQKFLEAYGVTVLSLSIVDGDSSRFARLGTLPEDRERVLKINGKYCSALQDRALKVTPAYGQGAIAGGR